VIGHGGLSGDGAFYVVQFDADVIVGAVLPVGCAWSAGSIALRRRGGNGGIELLKLADRCAGLSGGKGEGGEKDRKEQFHEKGDSPNAGVKGKRILLV
jgi:hypothetical protein